VETNTITSEVEEDSTTCANVRITNLDDKEESTMPEPRSPKKNMTNEEEESLKPITPRTKKGSNDVNNKSREVEFT
jgi:hypothetical protein